MTRKIERSSRIPRGIQVDSIDYHRNGVSGMPFYAVLFTDPDVGRMVASVFEGSDSFCAVYRIASLASGDIEFGSNSWRGDEYEDLLRPLIQAWRVEQGWENITQ